MPPPPGQDPTALSFQVLAEIAAGESAKVDLCRVTSGPADGRLVAVKRLHPHLASDPAFVTQFRDEMWMTAALRHPNVVEVVGWGSDNDGLYLAVELVQGVSLSRLMKTIFDTGEAFTERMVVFLARQVCRGLGTAHALRTPSGEHMNLVHRDLTPGNVLCSFQGDVKITDFGLAKAKQRLTRTLTGMVKGQLEYISPEQATGVDVDARADIFSLGVMLFELFAGRRPWVASNDMDLARKLMTEPPTDLFKLRPKIDRELVSIVNKCLEKNPKTRFQSVSEILARLDEWLSAHGYMEDNEEALGRFVRRNAMRQMAWFERAIAGSGAAAGSMTGPESLKVKPRPPTFTGASVAVPSAAKIPPPADSAPPTERPGTKRSVSPFATKAARPSPSVDIAEETTADAKIPQGAKVRPLANVPKIVEAKNTGEGEVDWGEEVATLVKGATPPQLAKLRQAFKGGKPFDPKLAASESNAARPGPIDEAADTAKRAPMPSATVVEGLAADKRAFDDVAVDSSENVTAPRGVHALAGKGSSPDNEKSPPATTRSAGSAPPPAMQGGPDAPGDERLRVESERLSIEAVRLAEEAKAAYVRAERKAALAKAAQDAAAIAADAVRISRASGVAEGLRRLDVALAMERSARANEGRANEGASAATVSAPPPSGLLAMAPPPIPPAPRLPSVQPQASPSIPAPLAIPKSPPVPGRSVPPPAGASRGADHASHGSSDRQAMPAAVLGPDADAFATQLRPRVMGLPLPVLGIIAVGIVVVVLAVLVIAFG